MEVARLRLSVDEVLSRIGFGKFQVFLIALGAIFTATEAIEFFMISITLPIFNCVWHVSSTEAGSLTAASFIGSLFGGLVCGSAADLYGRRTILILSSTLVLIYGCLSSVSPNFGWLVVLRLISGISFYIFNGSYGVIPPIPP